MKKRLLATALAGILAIGAVSTTQKPNTVQNTAYASNNLEFLHSIGIIEGYDDGLLHPEKTLTRAQFAKILVSAFGSSYNNLSQAEFSDVDQSHWAYSHILTCQKQGWLNGYPDNTFRPEEEISYEQALTTLCRVLDLTSYSYPESYPESYLSLAMEYSLTDGINALIGERINRDQTATMIVNSINYQNAELKAEDASYKLASPAAIPSTSMPSLPAAAPAGGGGSGAYPSIDEDRSYMSENPPVYYNTEEYDANDENVFKDATSSPLSTFSIDTDTASYSNLRRFIVNGQSIPNGSVRIEEMINYFDFEKSAPEDGVPFGVNYTLGSCPWNEDNLLAMLTVSGEELTEPKPSNIVFLIDSSGSMISYNKLPLVKQSLSLLLDKLTDKDKISIVTYASGSKVVLEPTVATDKDTIMSALDSVYAGGGTWGASGINLAYEQAEKYKVDGNNRIILCTDGDFNIGESSEGDLEELITKKRDSGIFLSVLGFGMGNYKDNKMETLADKGNGNYAYIDSLKEAKKVLVDEMSKTIYTIAKDVKIQVEFNPAVVSEYRLVGYENRMLNTEDFDNDRKDAGELGAGSVVTVLYEIVPQTGDVKSSLKYQETIPTGSDELATLKLRYKEPDGDESILREYPLDADVTDETSDDFRFACAVAELGMIINQSEYMGTSTIDSVVDLARGALGEDKYGIRCEFLQLADLYRYKENK